MVAQSATSTLDQVAQGLDGLAARHCPGHARAFKALRNQSFATCFHHAAGNGQVLADVFSVAHAVALIVEVGQFGL